MRIRILLLLVAIAVFPACRQPRQEVQVDDAPAITMLDVGTGDRLEPGLSVKVKVTIARKNLTDPVRVELKNLPSGLSANAVTIAARENVGEIDLVASMGITPGKKAGVTCVARSGDATLTSAPFAITVSPPSITFAMDPPQLKIPPGQSRKVKVTFQRSREAFQGPVAIALADLPKGVEATVLGKGPQGGDLATFVVKAGLDAAAADVQAFVRVIGDKETRGIAVLPVTVLGAPFTLKLEPTRVKAVYGQATKVKISANRKDYQGPIAIQFDNLPSGVKVRPFTLPAQQTSGELDLTIAGDALSAEKAVKVTGSTDDSRQGIATFDLRIDGRPFALQVQPTRIDVVQGATAKLKVIAIRAKDYTGPIALDLRNLPKNCKASSFGIPVQGKEAEIDVTAEDAAAIGDTSGVQVVGSALVGGDKRDVTYDKLAVRVLPVFSLSVLPGKVELVEGQKTIIKVNAERRTYKGIIAVELRNLPKGVTATKADIPRDKTTVEIELSADTGTGGAKTSTHALGTTITTKQVASAGFNVSVLGKLFELKIDKLVKVTFGSTAPLRVTAQRQDYQGPIELELKNLPAQIKASKAIIPAGQNDIDIELAASLDAKEAKADAYVVGTAVAAGRQQRDSNVAAIQVMPGLFDLKIESSILQIHHGGAAKVKVIAQRKGHDGPISVELKNLPANMKAEKATIAKGENHAEIEVKAAATVSDGAKVDVFARGVPMGLSKNIDSSRFTVAVISIGQPPNLELKVAPAMVQLVPGGSAKVKVSAVRKSYAGPITVDLRNLPPEVESSKGTIAAGENEVEITLTARAKAEPVIKSDVCAVGVATASENCPYASPQLTVRVLRK